MQPKTGIVNFKTKKLRELFKILESKLTIKGRNELLYQKGVITHDDFITNLFATTRKQNDEGEENCKEKKRKTTEKKRKTTEKKIRSSLC